MTRAQYFSAVSIAGMTRVRRVRLWQTLGPVILIALGLGMWIGNVVTLAVLRGLP